MYQISDESLDCIRKQARSRLQTWELEIAGITKPTMPIQESTIRYTRVQGEAGIIELVARNAQLNSESRRN
jgi:hypothetical protein